MEKYISAARFDLAQPKVHVDYVVCPPASHQLFLYYFQIQLVFHELKTSLLLGRQSNNCQMVQHCVPVLFSGSPSVSII